MATAYAPDFSQDYLVWDNRETVTVYPAPRREVLFFPVQNAKRRALNHRELAASGGAYTGEDIVWLLPVLESQAMMDAYPPTPGFIVEDNDLRRWTILEVALNTWKTWWRCVTRNLVLAANLRDTVTIQRPTISVGDSGQPVYSWPPEDGEIIAEEIAARVQLTDGAPITVNQVESTARVYDCILSQQIDLRKDDRIIWLNSDREEGNPKGMLLQWEQLWNPERIDELPRVRCKRV